MPNKARKDIAVEFLNLIALGRPKDGLFFFDPDCKTHNPYVVGGMKELIDAMIAVQKQGSEGILKGSKADFKLTIKTGPCRWRCSCGAYSARRLQSKRWRFEASASFPFPEEIRSLSTGILPKMIPRMRLMPLEHSLRMRFCQ